MLKQHRRKYYEKLSVLFIVLILILALSACGSITRKEALDIALEKAGVAEKDIRDLDIELDKDRGAKVWGIDFEHGNMEYSYDVDAVSGEVA